VHIREKDRMSGFLELENANVNWFLSTNKTDLPKKILNARKPMLRIIKINNEEISLSEGFTDLHTKVYEEILNGNGFGIDDARPSIKLVHEIRKCEISKNKKSEHPLFTKTFNN
jgi:UDP-N-acetyl-2-amino-2-deoxyglucuronate dehydrogenase